MQEKKQKNKLTNIKFKKLNNERRGWNLGLLGLKTTIFNNLGKILPPTHSTLKLKQYRSVK